MSSHAVVIALVEGITEQRFINQILAPVLYPRNIYLSPVVISKPGQKGGDVKFERVKNDIGDHLKQRQDTFVTLFLDFYGIKGDWPEIDEARRQNSAALKAEKFKFGVKNEVQKLFGDYYPEKRFIPYVSMHEFEALLFSDPAILAAQLPANESVIEKILKDCGEPESINDSFQTAPSKRLETLCGRYKKTTTGIAIAEKIGIAKMRQACPLFGAWLDKIEKLGVA
jgi:hypothetical protein